MRLVLSVLLLAASLLAAVEPGRERTFTLEYNASVKDIPAATQKVELWIVANIRVDAPYPYKISVGGQGNTMLHLEIARPKETSVPVTVPFEAARKERIQPTAAVLPKMAPPADLAHWLQPHRLVPIDNKIRGWAREAVDAAHDKTDLEMARAIYNHVVSTVKYDQSGAGWGRGDICHACDARRGNCTDFHVILIGYARAMGIPARFAIGFPLPWAEFYAKGIGWVPMDASEAAKNPAKRDYFFGAHDENRVELSKSRDVLLTPRQQADPLNYFVYPYVEVDGKAYTSIETSYSFHDLMAVA